MQDAHEGLILIKVRRCDGSECQDNKRSSCMRQGASFSVIAARPTCGWSKACIIKVPENPSYNVSKTRFDTIISVLAQETQNFYVNFAGWPVSVPVHSSKQGGLVCRNDFEIQATHHTHICTEYIHSLGDIYLPAT